MNSPDTTADAAELESVIFEVKKVIVGQDRVVERLLVGLLARGHCLLEGLPGLAKTLAAETLAKVVGGTFHRIQFTPDLLPSDVVGTRVYRASTETFDVELGPVFANFVLADEINRAPAKVQSALLEIMAEHQVSIGGTTFEAPKPFLVLATQNPIESEGVYQLPEAQRDRFLMKILVDYPSAAEEAQIVTRMGVHPPEVTQVIDPERLITLQNRTDQVYVDRAVVEYAVSVVLATRDPGEYGLDVITPYLSYGASPRASLGLVAGGRALALLRGRTYVLPQDVFDVAPDVLRHRLVPSYEALADSISTDQILAKILSTVPAPRISPAHDGQRPIISSAPPTPQAQAQALAHAHAQAQAQHQAAAQSQGWGPPPDPFQPPGTVPAPWAPPATLPGYAPTPYTPTMVPPPTQFPPATPHPPDTAMPAHPREPAVTPPEPEPRLGTDATVSLDAGDDEQAG